MSQDNQGDDPDNLTPDSERELATRMSALQEADKTFYNLMSLELWAIAKTMDEREPGFWLKYMKNRQTVMKQHLEQKRASSHSEAAPSERRAFTPWQQSPLRQDSDVPLEESIDDRVSLFSETLERDLPQMHREVNRTDSPVGADDLEIENVAPHEANAPDPDGKLLELPATEDLPEIALLGLPHLVRQPAVRGLPPLEEAIAAQGWVRVALDCWLTSHYLVPASDPSRPPVLVQTSNAIALAPNQWIICQLGFRWRDPAWFLRVRLAKSLRACSGLSATWYTAENSGKPDNEVSIQLSYQGDRPISLQAGQPFCRLEFYCPHPPQSGENVLEAVEHHSEEY
jgi:hypothetical protein